MTSEVLRVRTSCQRRSRRAQWLAAMAASAGIASIVAKNPVDGTSAGLETVAIATLLFAVLLGCVIRDFRPLSSGELSIDARGRFAWAPAAGPRPMAVEPQAWYLGADRLWMTVAMPGTKRSRRIVVDRVGLDESRWRALRSWVVWLERGGAQRS
ncbi:MAG: hypothetical protein H6934_01125 [Burkholderiaceae bacterium]|nr:hypothetical protein [Burkholderiaceae bacterium]